MTCILWCIAPPPFGEKCTVSIKQQWRSYAPCPPKPPPVSPVAMGSPTQDLPLSPISPRLPQPTTPSSACRDLLLLRTFPSFSWFPRMCHRIHAACFPQMLQEGHFNMSALTHPPACPYCVQPSVYACLQCAISVTAACFPQMVQEAPLTHIYLSLVIDIIYNHLMHWPSQFIFYQYQFQYQYKQGYT